MISRRDVLRGVLLAATPVGLESAAAFAREEGPLPNDVLQERLGRLSLISCFVNAAYVSPHRPYMFFLPALPFRIDPALAPRRDWAT